MIFFKSDFCHILPVGLFGYARKIIAGSCLAMLSHILSASREKSSLKKTDSNFNPTNLAIFLYILKVGSGQSTTFPSF